MVQCHLNCKMEGRETIRDKKTGISIIDCACVIGRHALNVPELIGDNKGLFFNSGNETIFHQID